LSEALDKGKAQVSKYVRGVQPLFREGEREKVMSLGIKIVDVEERYIKGIENKAPSYDNEYLVEEIKRIGNLSSSAIRMDRLGALVATRSESRQCFDSPYISEDDSSSPLSDNKEYVIVLGGPDGVLLPYDSFRKTQLKDSINYEPLLDLLRLGRKVVIVSNLRYYSALAVDINGKTIEEKGIQERVVGHIPASLRRYLTVYASAGSFKVKFDAAGNEITDSKFNDKNCIDPVYVLELEERLQGIIDSDWGRDSKRLSVLRNTYPTFIFRKPQIIKHQDNSGRVYSMSVLYLPSVALDVVNLEPGEKI